MGTTPSSPAPLAPAFRRLSSWDLKAARRLLQGYKDKDLDFGLDAQSLGELVGGDKQWAEDIIDAFGSSNGIVNALAFISGACLVSSGPALEKASLVFDAMDFDSTEQISMDEMTIIFLCCCRGLCVMAGVGAVPSDEALETVTLQAYRDYSKSSAQSISKTEFSNWVIKFAAGSSSGRVGRAKEVSLQGAMEAFGVVSSPDPVDATSSNGDWSNCQSYEDEFPPNGTAVHPSDVSFDQDAVCDSAKREEHDAEADYAVDTEHFETARHLEEEIVEQKKQCEEELAEQYEEQTEQYGEQAEPVDYVQQEDENHGSSIHEPPEDESSRDAYDDEDYATASEDASASAYLPVDPSDLVPAVEDQPSHEMAESEVAHDIGDYPPSNPDGDGQDEVVDAPMEANPLASLRVEASESPETTSALEGSAVPDADNADCLEVGASAQSVVIEGEPIVDNESGLVDANTHENLGNDDDYDEEFTHDDSAEEPKTARREADEIGEYSAEFQEEAIGSKGDSFELPAQDDGAESGDASEDWTLETAAPHDAAVSDIIEPPEAEVAGANAEALVQDSSSKEHDGEEEDDGEAFEPDAVDDDSADLPEDQARMKESDEGHGSGGEEHNGETFESNTARNTADRPEPQLVEPVNLARVEDTTQEHDDGGDDPKGGTFEPNPTIGSAEPPQDETVDQARVENNNNDQGDRDGDDIYESIADQQEGTDRPQDNSVEPNTVRDGAVDLNAFDTYDYEDAAYDGASGLAPPEDDAPTHLESFDAVAAAGEAASTPEEPEP